MIATPDTFRVAGNTIAVLPDLQNYTGHQGRHFPVLLETVDWILAERERLGIELVVQVGDLTDRNSPSEWRRARKAFSRFDGVLPYIVTVGNHDLGLSQVGGNRFTFLNQHFRSHDNLLNQRLLVETCHPGQLENSASLVRLGRRDWLILALEFGPREPVVAWADRVLQRHAKHPTLIVTHEYIDQLSKLQHGRVMRSQPESRNSPYVYGLAGAAGGVNCGEELWSKLVAPHSQVAGVVNGHYQPFKRNWISGRISPTRGVVSSHRSDFRADGSRVDQWMFNAQWAPRGGDGWLMLLQTTADGRRLKARRMMAPTAKMEW